MSETETKTNDTATDEKEKQEVKPAKKSTKTVKIPLNTMIPCKNGTMGRLAYGSSRIIGYSIIWSEPNAVEYVEFQELISMRNTAPKFFRKNWIIPVDDEYSAEEVLKQLTVLTYYKNYIDTEKLDEFFEKPTLEIEDTLALLSDGQKDVVYFKALELFKEEKLSDLKKIKTLERILGKKIME